MFVNREKYTAQMNAYAKLVAGTVSLVHEELGPAPKRGGRRFGHEIADEIIRFETQLAKVLLKNVSLRTRAYKRYKRVCPPSRVV